MFLKPLIERCYVLEVGLDNWGGGRSACRREPLHVKGKHCMHTLSLCMIFARLLHAATLSERWPLHVLFAPPLPQMIWLVQTEREQLTQLVFEHNNVAGFFLCDQPLLSMYAVGRLSGCVVDYGHEKTGEPYG